MSSLNIALTGGTGFIGGHLLKALLEGGHSVVALTRPGSLTPKINHERLAWTTQESFENELCSRRFDAVLHMATNYGVGQALASTVMTNVVMPLRILEYAARGGCPLFVNTDTFFSKQNYNYNHMKSYTASKVELVKWIELFLCENSEVRVVNARLEHVYGPGDSLPKFVPFAIQQLIKNEQLDLSPGEQVRDFIYIEDVVSAYITLVNSAKKLRTGLTEFEVGTGVGYSIRTFVEIAKNLTQSKSILNFGAMPYRPSEIMHSIANTHNLIDMGWMPRVSLKDGLLATINKAKVL